MNLGSLLIGVLLSTLYGALFHLLRGGGFGRLVLYLILGWIGFWAGQFIAAYYQFDIGSLGQLHVGVATLSSLLFLVAGAWLTSLPKYS